MWWQSGPRELLEEDITQYSGGFLLNCSCDYTRRTFKIEGYQIHIVYVYYVVHGKDTAVR